VVALTESPADEGWLRRWISIGAVLPADAVAVLGFVVVANGVFLAPVGSIVLRALVGLPFLFFLPGYAIVAALFPERNSLKVTRLTGDVTGGEIQSPQQERDVDWRARAALAFGTSVAVLPIFALALSLAGLSYRLTVVAPALSAVGLTGMAVAVVQRTRLPERRRFRIPYREWTETARRGLFGRESPLDAGINIALALVVVVSMAGIGFAVVVPNGGASYTSVSLLTANESGDLVTGDYPGTLDGSGSNFVLSVENEQGHPVTYEAVGELQRVRTDGSGLRVLTSREVLRTGATVKPGSMWQASHTVRPELSGEDLRLVYYLYRGEAPDDPSTRSAYRYVYIWIDAPPRQTT